MEQIKVGLIGYGLSGRIFHEPFLESVNGLVAYKIFDRNAANASALREKHSSETIAQSVEEVIDCKEIELIVIAVQNAQHFALAKRALEAGKHVVVEKPFTVTTAEAEELIEVANRTGRLLTVYQNRRFDGDFRTIQKLCESKLLGEIVEYEAHFDRYKKEVRENAWRESEQAGAGYLYDLGSHLIDQALVLFGTPQAVFGDLCIQRSSSRIIDSFEVLLRYEGLKVTLKSGMLVRDPGPRFQINGTKGSFVKHGLDVQEDALRIGLRPKNGAVWGAEPKAMHGTLHADLNGIPFYGKIESEPGDYRLFYENLRDAILRGTPLAVLPEQARDVIKVIELSIKSNETKQWQPF